MTTKLPTYDFYKRLHSQVSLEYSRLEKAYNSYDAGHAHRHDYFEIIIFNNTGGKHEIDFNVYPILKNTIHLITPGRFIILKEILKSQDM